MANLLLDVHCIVPYCCSNIKYLTPGLPADNFVKVKIPEFLCLYFNVLLVNPPRFHVSACFEERGITQ